MKRGPFQREEVSREVEEGGERDRSDRADQPRSDDRRDRVRRVVQAVQEIERERDDDEADEQRKGELVHAPRRSGVVDHDAVDLVRDILERVGDPLEMLVDLAGDDELHRLVAEWPGTPS